MSSEDGITVCESFQITSATKSANSDHTTKRFIDKQKQHAKASGSHSHRGLDYLGGWPLSPRDRLEAAVTIGDGTTSKTFWIIQKITDKGQEPADLVGVDQPVIRAYK
jgi:hypothetical protein